MYWYEQFRDGARDDNERAPVRPAPGRSTLTSRLFPSALRPVAPASSNDAAPARGGSCEVGDPFALHLGQDAADDAPVAPDNACAPDAARADDAISGIQSYLAFPSGMFRELEGPHFEHMRDFRTLGPGDVGRYILLPYLRDGRLVAYVAQSTQTYQREWVIGPDSVDAFVVAQAMYAQAARKLMPISDHLAKQTGTPASDPHVADVVELDNHHQAPWAQDAEAPEGAFVQSAGSAANAARNARIRLNEYVEPARRMATELRAKVDAGELDHLDARRQAVDGRNELMEGARARMSPGARATSRALKERGVTVEQMTTKKVTQLIEQARGLGADGAAATDAARLRTQLAEDSPLWAEYARQLDEAPQSAARGAVFERLGESPLVSRAIIDAAGRPNRMITGFAKLSQVAGMIGVAAGLEQMTYEIVTAADGHRLHVAAREFSAFAGGLVGAEAGSVAGAWFASLLPLAGEAAGPVGLVVTLVAGGIGSMVGAATGREVFDLAQQAVVGAAASAMPFSIGISGGGFTGMRDREARAHDPNFQHQLEDAIWTLSDTMKQLEQRIAAATNDHDLNDLQRARFEILRRRTVLETALTGLHLGWFDTTGSGECSRDDQPE